MTTKLTIDLDDLETLITKIAVMDGAHAMPQTEREFSNACEQAYEQINKMAGIYAGLLSIASDEEKENSIRAINTLRTLNNETTH